MRLDEWQKYIETQFLDDAPGPKPTPAPAQKPPATTEPAAPIPLLWEEAEEAPAADIPLAPITLTEPPDTSGATSSLPPIHESRPSPRSAPATLAFEPITDLDTEIPAFEQYLPASHTQRPPNPAVPTAPASQSATVAPPERADQTKPERQTPAATEAPTPPRSPHLAASEPTATPTAVPTPTPPEEANVPPRASARRTPRTHARHARNVRPENVPSGLSAAELWATVPKHVQTLLALERMEEEKEIAQFSYKRPFQEKRHELIERLLDPILSLEDAARLLNVCPTTVRRYTNKGILTYYRKEPDKPTRESTDDKETRQRRFRLSDILAFLETQQAALEADRQTESRRATRARAGTPPQDAPETASHDADDMPPRRSTPSRQAH